MNNKFIIKITLLPWTTTVPEIMAFFNDCEIKNGANGILLVRSRDGKPTGDAYVELVKWQDLELALLHDCECIGNRYIQIVCATPSSLKYAKRNNGKSVMLNDDRYVLVQGLPCDFSETDVRYLFRRLTITRNGVIFTYNYLGMSKGEAYVQFASREEADMALEYHGRCVRHHFIEVLRSSLLEMQITLFEDSIRHNRLFINRPHFIHLHGLPLTATTHSVAIFFAPIVTKRIYILRDVFGKSTGYADVEFFTHNDALRAMTQNKKFIGRRYIKLFLNSTY